MNATAIKNGRVSFGTVSGPYAKEIMVCQPTGMVRPMQGIMYGENPLDFSLPITFVQITLVFMTTRVIYFLLKPLRQSYLSAQILAGITLGPSFLWHYFPSMLNIFPPDGRVILHTLAYMGLIFHLFLQTLQMDTSIIRKAGGKAVLIGTMSVILPNAIGVLAFKTVVRVMTLDKLVLYSIPRVIILTSMSAFPVITDLLSDLKILNSDLGRLACNASIICDITTFLFSQILRFFFLHRSYEMVLESVTCFVTLLVTIVFIIRPFIIWLTRYTKPGEPMEESHFFIIVLIVLMSSLCSEVLGYNFSLGPILLGVVLPDGPPLGVELEQKLDTFCNGLLLPIFSAISGLNMNVFNPEGENYRGIVEIIIIVTYTAKFISTLLPALCCHLPLLDAICLALIMCCKGIIEVAVSCSWKDAKMLDNQSFCTLLITMLIITGISRPLISYLYDPSKRYMTSKRRTILDSDYNPQAPMLVCIHNADNVPMIINILKACNPTRLKPVTVFVLHLLKLTSRGAAILKPHHPLVGSKLKLTESSSEHTVKAFNSLEKQHQGSIIVQHYTAVAPYKSMHNDICTIAQDKRITIVILPFHKQWSIDGKVGSINPSVRHINQNVMDSAPCSVGILIDRELKGKRRSIKIGQSTCCIAVLLFGGDDDYEALALGRRLAEHPQVDLIVVLVKHHNEDPEMERNIKIMIKKFSSSDCKDRIRFEEVTVKNGEETIQVIRSFEDTFDLVIVGRTQDSRSPLALGLTEWSECPELGVFGDMLSSSDFRFSVLVVTQQPLKEPLNDGPKTLSISASISSNGVSDDEECRPMRPNRKEY